jgi:sensor histidine kinase YesM
MAEKSESRESPDRGAALIAWVAVLASFTVLAVLYALQTHAQTALEGRPEPWFSVVRRQLVLWWIRAALAPVALFLAARLRNTRLALSATAHVTAALLYGCVAALLTGTIDYLFRLAPPSLTFSNVLLANLLVSIATGVLAYLLIAASYTTLTYARDRRQRELETAELRRELAESQLQFLRMQLQPHFLFNALNSVSALMGQDVHRARVALSRVGELLRKSVDDATQHEIALRAELELVSAYTDIQRMRFGERLDISIEVDEAAMDTLVPSFLLQPILENAIKFGLERRGGTSRIVVRGGCDDGTLTIEVVDDAGGFTFDRDVRLGVGLGNTRARLFRLYGAAGSFEILPNGLGGATVRMSVPCRKSR